ncbi:MAG: hypothetical protein ABJK11_13505 [Balneola sp.]
MKYLKNPILLITSFFVIATVAYASFYTTSNNNDLTEEDYALINDYSSTAFQEVSPADFSMSENELLDFMRVPNEKREVYDFNFYKLDYKGLKELHVKGNAEGKSCYALALVNIDSFLDNTQSASFINFFQSTIPSESHSCEGDPCESCEFERNQDDEITGCDCSYLGGHCNHTVTSG